MTVTKQANVGPYETVQLHSTDSSALDNWLTQNGFNIPAAVQPVIDAYVAEGFDFLAMKLLPNQGVQAMRPVRVTTPGASLSLPLRMASVGTGATVGITIWVVGDGRYEPQNFPFFHIDDSALVWDWSTNSSNYTTLRVQNEAKLENGGWEIESSITLNQQTITNVILSGGQYYGSGLSSSSPVDADAGLLPVGDPDAGADDGGYESAEHVRDDDIATLFAGLTGPTERARHPHSQRHRARGDDHRLRPASVADQSELSNVRTVTQSVNLVCPIYSGCTVVGTGTLAQAQASVSDAGASLDATVADEAGAAPTTIGGEEGGPALDGTVADEAGSQSATSGGEGGEGRAGSGGGCDAAAQGPARWGVGWGACAGLLGLIAGRAIRSRRRRGRR